MQSGTQLGVCITHKTLNKLQLLCKNPNGSPEETCRLAQAANTACTRPPAKCAGAGVVGVCAFSGSFFGSKLVPSTWRYRVPPTSPHQGANATGTPAKYAGTGRKPLGHQ